VAEPEEDQEERSEAKQERINDPLTLGGARQVPWQGHGGKEGDSDSDEES
jgi:hypothetical protein